MSRQQITIPLDIADVDVIEVAYRGGAYHIKLESSLGYAYCRQCGQKITALHEREAWVKVQHLPILDRAVFLYYRPRRYRCPDCDGRPTTTQQLSWHEANSPHTVAYDRYLLRALVNSTVEDVTRKEPVSYDSMMGVLKRCVQTQVEWKRYSDLSVLGIDEIALKKGQRDYVVIVSSMLKHTAPSKAHCGPSVNAKLTCYLKNVPCWTACLRSRPRSKWRTHCVSN